MTVTVEQGTSASPASYAEVVDRLRATFASGRTRSVEWRLAQLKGLAKLLSEREDELGKALIADLRRTPFESLLFDITPTKAEVTFAIKHVQSWMRPRRVHAPAAVLPARAWYQYEPLGVVLNISPWNYPIHLALTPLVAALAAGNCAILKPSEIAPACSKVLADLLPRYLDPDAIAVVEGGADVSLGLLDQGLNHCFFTGSPAVGSAVMTAAARHLTPVTLELGGKCPAIVTSSARLDIAARRIAFGKLVNSGQTCVAPDYVLVDATVRDEFVGLLSATISEFSESKSVPIVNQRHAARLEGLLRGAGGETVLGGVLDVEAALAQPTIILDPDPAAPILQEEVFGPLLAVVTVNSLGEAISHVQRGSHPLASYLFTEDRADEEQVLASISSGGTVINHVMMHLSVSDLPFGGVGTSGMGQYHGRWGFETFSHPKAVLRKPSRPDFSFIYPPYSGMAQRVMKKLL
jgi:aldehyde dehydrogenase (NAD+)